MSIIPEDGDLEEYFREYSDMYYEETALDIWNNCVVLSILSVVPSVLSLVVPNLVFGCLVSTGFIPLSVLHFSTGCIGIYLVSTLESHFGKIVLLFCWIISYVLLYTGFQLKKYSKSSISLKLTFIILLVLCEYYLIEAEVWLQIRGIVMVLVMKVLSLADDINKLDAMPGFIQYFGYTLCGANVMFGPWISFSDYLNFYKKPTKKNLIWICAIVKVLTTSLFFLTLSNCWSGYIISDDANRWLIAYKEAFAFRTSHYFISYLAEVGMIAAGFTNSSKRDSLNQYRFVITEPLEIEFPSSLSIVVKKWNQPMHDFLKKYVYYSWLGFGKFYAILATFLISSLLHGLELKVSMVLVSIGVFSYLQVVPRDRIAEIFDYCVRVRPCKDCKHKYKRDNIRVRIILLIYSLATVFHLAYLGVLMDPSTNEIGIYEKWQNLYFISHIVMFFNVMVIL
ncbi:protein-serine O-palmitoleoyltransferase porcupine [Tribolium castaneum]|uniref:Protein-serine O-palmitoleoyltransferase porcupine n=1 Tax=Tribolium castaneum TaxID=7070 RepID=D6W7A5_TRICA|nr:PREDICTED: protein-serine O-palmitoleoyltransferase porcupine [Tribolium castaneum]EFA11115.1 Protein-cysteine N-palmitoyltransferase porcupine-like Protein [Tribolium castaneum]|eukprot:XP_970892.1 PREDICTED: protein-serine O-palmitoleoyltransferase porcupine [Tribolium castaneum]